jgi:DeoR/GlpR family transcriptional regulator of sugar metabolism
MTGDERPGILLVDDDETIRAGLGAFLERSGYRVIVAADRSKLGRVTFTSIAALGDIHVIITDGDPQHPTLVAARKEGVDVVCVDGLDAAAAEVESL